MMHIMNFVTQRNVEFRTSFLEYVVLCDAHKGWKYDHAKDIENRFIILLPMERIGGLMDGNTVAGVKYTCGCD
jgi:hypothetical protein